MICRLNYGPKFHSGDALKLLVYGTERRIVAPTLTHNMNALTFRCEEEVTELAIDNFYRHHHSGLTIRAGVDVPGRSTELSLDRANLTVKGRLRGRSGCPHQRRC